MNVCILSRGERSEGVIILSVHKDVPTAQRAAREYAYEGTGRNRRIFPLLDWKREGNVWTVESPNRIDYLEIRKLVVL